VSAVEGDIRLTGVQAANRGRRGLADASGFGGDRQAQKRTSPGLAAEREIGGCQL
jgi:hypothetical protein